MVNRLCAAVRRCAAAIAIDPSVEPAQNRCCFKRFFISVLLLLLSNFESRTERVGLPVLPLLFPGRCAAPNPESPPRSRAYPVPTENQAVGWRWTVERPRTSGKIACGCNSSRGSPFPVKKVFFFIFMTGRGAGPSEHCQFGSVRLNCLHKEISVAPEVIEPGFPTFFHATTAK